MRSAPLMVLLLTSLNLHASILTFDGLDTTFSPIPQNYGDRISSDSDVVGSYQQGNAYTPNIITAYRTLNLDLSEATDFLRYFPSNYGDLINVAMPANFFSIAEIVLIPDEGWGVTLNQFDMAAWPSVDLAADLLAVYDSVGNELWNSNGTLLISSGPSHEQFTPAVSSDGPLTIRWGNTWDIGIDNIHFDQFTLASEPGYLLLLGLIILYSQIKGRSTRA